MQDCQRMDVSDVEDMTGLCKDTLYKLMDMGTADLGVVIPGKKKTYVFFRPKVERFVMGGSKIDDCPELVGSVKRMNHLLTHAILSLPDGRNILREISEEEKARE